MHPTKHVAGDSARDAEVVAKPRLMNPKTAESEEARLIALKALYYGMEALEQGELGELCI